MLVNPCMGKKIIIPKDIENKKRIEDKELPVFSTDEMKNIKSKGRY